MYSLLLLVVVREKDGYKCQLDSIGWLHCLDLLYLCWFSVKQFIAVAERRIFVSSYSWGFVYLSSQVYQSLVHAYWDFLASTFKSLCLPGSLIISSFCKTCLHLQWFSWSLLCMTVIQSLLLFKKLIFSLFISSPSLYFQPSMFPNLKCFF